MLQTIAQLSLLFSFLLILPAYITAFLILKEYKIKNIRFSKYFKFLLLQGLIHSFFLVMSLFLADFKLVFLVHSFGMVPLYGLLLFRRFYLNHKESARSEAIRTVSLPKKKVAPPRIDPAKLKGIRLVGQRKSQWH